MLVWVIVLAAVGLSLVALAVALLRAWRAGKALAAAVGAAGESLAPLSELQVGASGPPAAPLSEAELRAREAALLQREAELEQRLRTARS